MRHDIFRQLKHGVQQKSSNIALGRSDVCIFKVEPNRTPILKYKEKISLLFFYFRLLRGHSGLGGLAVDP